MAPKIYPRLAFVNGLTQDPRDNDFTITPCLKFGRMPKEYSELKKKGDGFCLGIEWGHWAIVFQLFILYKTA